MRADSELKYILPILAFCAGVIGMFAAFVFIGPWAGILIFWVDLIAGGYYLYKLLTENAET